MFTGDDPDDWVNRVERYFEFHQLTGKEQLNAAMVSLEGNALTLFK